MRFLNADPSGFSGGSNWFAYANGNPISLSDPFGLCAEEGGFWNSITRSIAKFVEDNAEMDARSDSYNAWLDTQDSRTQFAYRWGGMFVDPQWIIDPSEHKEEMAVWGTIAILTDGLVRRVPMNRGPSPWLAAEAAEDTVTVYRGVHGSHPDVEAAYRGEANPMGGHSNPLAHNQGDNQSIFTSWSTDRNAALEHATQWGTSEGVLLEQTVPRSSLVPSPDLLRESEVLRVGPISGATPTILK
jgi:hypothetical protein